MKKINPDGVIPEIADIIKAVNLTTLPPYYKQTIIEALEAGNKNQSVVDAAKKAQEMQKLSTLKSIINEGYDEIGTVLKEDLMINNSTIKELIDDLLFHKDLFKDRNLSYNEQKPGMGVMEFKKGKNSVKMQLVCENPNEAGILESIHIFDNCDNITTSEEIRQKYELFIDFLSIIALSRQTTNFDDVVDQIETKSNNELSLMDKINNGRSYVNRINTFMSADDFENKLFKTYPELKNGQLDGVYFDKLDDNHLQLEIKLGRFIMKVTMFEGTYNGLTFYYEYREENPDILLEYKALKVFYYNNKKTLSRIWRYV